MASQHFVIAEQAASSGPAAGFCYYCGAPLGAVHHSYCTLLKALPPPTSNNQRPISTPHSYHQTPHHGGQVSTAGGSAASQAGGYFPGEIVPGHVVEEYGQFDWQAPPPVEGWQAPAPSPPPPPPEERSPPLPPEEGQAPLPPAEHPPPPPEEPAAGVGEAGLPWNAAMFQQPSSSELTWDGQAGASCAVFGQSQTGEPGAGSLGQPDAALGGMAWGNAMRADESALPWQGQAWQGQAWSHDGGAGHEASTAPSAQDLPTIYQQLPLSNHSASAEETSFARAPWHHPNATVPSASTASAAPVPSASGMESIRDLYSASSQYHPVPQLPLPQAILHAPFPAGLQDPRFTVPSVGSLPFPLHSTPPPTSLPAQPRMVDAQDIFKQPGRSIRPDRFAVILRGLPGSGKSHLAKALRDVEVMNGGSAPRVHTMDEYFVTEVEKEVEVVDGRGRKRKITQTAMEYVYEPELEQVYCASMLKAFKNTLDEGRFHFVIVDYWNLVVSDFEPYWKAAKLDVVSLFKGDLLDTGDIAEVDMDADPEPDQAPSTSTKRPLYETDEEDEEAPHHEPPPRPSAPPNKGAIRDEHGSKRAESSPSRRQPVLGEASTGRPKARRQKEVKWADLEGEKEAAKGFRIGVDLSKKRKLEIGPGAGYSEDQTGPLRLHGVSEHAAFSKKVKAQVQDEAKAFKAVMARRRSRIGIEDDE